MSELKQSNKRILYLLFNPSPSARVRATIFENIYKEKGYEVKYFNMYSIGIQKMLGNKYLKNFSFIYSLCLSIERKVNQFLEKSVFKIASYYDGIILIKYVQPDFIQKLRLATNAKILYDFDDSMWLDSFIGINKFQKIIKACDYISCDNYILANEALKYNDNTFVLKGPTNVELYDPNLRVNKEKCKNGILKIGWLGSASTLFYLFGIYNVFDKIAVKYPNVVFKIIGSSSNFNTMFNFERATFEHIEKYDENSMIDELHDIDIGLFPLFENELSFGRGSLKATIYMSFGIPCIAFNIGMNKKIITNGINGFLASSENEWLNALSNLIESKELRSRIGSVAYETMNSSYTLQSCFKELEVGFLSKLI